MLLVALNIQKEILKIMIILFGQMLLSVWLFQGDTEDDVSGRVPKIAGADVEFFTQVQV